MTKALPTDHPFRSLYPAGAIVFATTAQNRLAILRALAYRPETDHRPGKVVHHLCIRCGLPYNEAIRSQIERLATRDGLIVRTKTSIVITLAGREALARYEHTASDSKIPAYTLVTDSAYSVAEPTGEPAAVELRSFYPHVSTSGFTTSRVVTASSSVPEPVQMTLSTFTAAQIKRLLETAERHQREAERLRSDREDDGRTIRALRERTKTLGVALDAAKQTIAHLEAQLAISPTELDERLTALGA